MRYDLAVTGSGGPGSLRRSRPGTKAGTFVMIERGTVVGTCVNTGCVPSKALLVAANQLRVADIT